VRRLACIGGGDRVSAVAAQPGIAADRFAREIVQFLKVVSSALVPGCILMAVALARWLRTPWFPALLTFAGTLICVGGVTQRKSLLVIGGATLVIFSLEAVRHSRRGEAVAQHSTVLLS
jgi:hypothetical protein